MWRPGKESKAILRLIDPGKNQYLDYERINRSLSGQNGISSVEINLVTNTAKIEFEQNKVTIEELHDAVKKACKESIAGSASPVSTEGKR
jgi:copper chaperone CopZ